MKLKLTFEVEVDEEGFKTYRATYAGTMLDDETVEQTLSREAIAQWEWEGLVKLVSVNGEPVA